MDASDPIRPSKNSCGTGSVHIWVPAFAGTTTDGDLPLHERLFDHEVTGFVVAAFEKAAGLEQLAQFFQHAGAAAHHDAVGRDVERRLVDVVEQLRGGDQVGD